MIAFDKLGFSKCVTAFDVEVLNTMQEQVHTRNGRRDEVTLLSVELESAIFFALALQFCYCREQHATGATGRIVDGFAWLRVKYQRHKVNEGAVCVEFRCGMAT